MLVGLLVLHRYERAVESMSPPAQIVQRSFSTPENFQRQAVMNSVLRQMSYGGKFGSPHLDQSGFSPSVQSQSHNHSFNPSSSSQWRQDPAAPLRKGRQNSHPYIADRHGREQRFPDCEQRYSDREPRYSEHSPDHHYRGSRDDFFYEDRSHDGRSQDYDVRRDSSRDGKWRSSRH